MYSSFILEAATNNTGCSAVVTMWCFLLSPEEVVMPCEVLQTFN